jgi:hypothetical protein
MKKLITIITLAALPVMAQSYAVITPSGVPGDIPLGGVTSNTTVNIDCRKHQNVAVHIRYASDGAVSSPVTNIVLTFNKSLDGTTFSTVATDKITWKLPLENGTSTNYATTNLSVGGLGYIRLESIASQDVTNSCTNIVFSYAMKIRAP